MTPKLTPPMITALTDAYRDGISRIDGASYVLRGVKTNTAEALRRRGLMTDRTVGAFGQYVLTSDGVDAARTIIAANTDATIADAELANDDDTPPMMAYIFDLTFVSEPFTASLPIMAVSELEARRIAVRLADGNWGTLATITLTNRAPLVHVLDITPGMVIITDTGNRVEVANVTADAFGVYLTPLTGQTVYVPTGTLCAQIGSFNLDD